MPAVALSSTQPYICGLKLSATASIHQDVLSMVQYIWSTCSIYKCSCMQSFMLSCGLLQLVELFDLEIHPQTAKNMKLKETYIEQIVVTGNYNTYSRVHHSIFRSI